MGRSTESGITFYRTPVIILQKVIIFYILTLLTTAGLRNFYDVPMLMNFAEAIMWILIVNVLLFVVLMILWLRVYTLITKDHLIHRKMGLIMQERCIPMNNIDGMNTKQNLLGKLFRYGDVTIEYGKSGRLTLRSIQNPDEFIFLMGKMQERQAIKRENDE